MREGYYWVQLNGYARPVIARWNNERWLFLAQQGYLAPTRKLDGKIIREIEYE